MTPIPLGSARGGLVPDIGSTIEPDEYGIDTGTIRYSLGSQAQARGLRPARGSAYNGNLPQFNGMFADTSRIIGLEGRACSIEVRYYALNATWGVPPPARTHDLELRDFFIGETIRIPGVPIPHPVLTYRFSDLHATEKLGKYGTPPNAPEVERYIYKIEVLVPTAVTGGVVTVDPVNTFNLVFDPHPLGWQCLQDDATPLCGGKFFAMEQRWKRMLVFTGVTAGTGE
jgi:hypothetical protein